MSTTFRCQNCGERKPRNPRLKRTQKFCGAHACQKARKRQWQQEKMAGDPEYRARQRQGIADWRKTHPSHAYQQRYRDAHPEYVEKNREQQRLRNQKRRNGSMTSGASQKIVKVDAFDARPVKSGIYRLTPYQPDAPGKIVKMDALFVELIVHSEDNPAFLQFFA